MFLNYIKFRLCNALRQLTEKKKLSSTICMCYMELNQTLPQEARESCLPSGLMDAEALEWEVVSISVNMASFFLCICRPCEWQKVLAGHHSHICGEVLQPASCPGSLAPHLQLNCTFLFGVPTFISSSTCLNEAHLFCLPCLSWLLLLSFIFEDSLTLIPVRNWCCFIVLSSNCLWVRSGLT
jgi:hypothetical protein